MKAFRYDRSPALRSPRKQSNGFLKADGAFTRVGVFTYGSRRELRLPGEVFSSSAMASYAGLPVTDGHPPGDGMVTADNASRFSKGWASNPRQDGDFLIGEITITDAALIKKMESGTKALSLGYDVDFIEGAGIGVKKHPLFGDFDFIQTNIRANHLAIVPAGRAGPEAKVRMDEAEFDYDPERAALIKEVYQLSDRRREDIENLTTDGLKGLRDALRFDAKHGPQRRATNAAWAHMNEYLDCLGKN